MNRAPEPCLRAYSRGMTTHELIAGAVALPIVIALAFVEPAVGLVAGFVAFAAVLKVLPLARRARVHQLPVEEPERRLAA